MTTQTPPAPTLTAPHARRPRSRMGLLLGVCCLAQFMVILDLSIVNVALPSIQAGLHFNSADLNWVVDAYAIMFGGFLMLAGRFGDNYGQRTTFAAALAVFSLASLLGGLAPTSGVLILARALQGFGGALMAASSLGIITANFAEGAERRRAISLWSSMNGIGGAAGVLLSGVITQYLSWRWVLLMNVPIGLGAVFVAWSIVPDRRAAQRPRFDIAGAVLLTFGLLVEAYGAVTAGNDGWGSAAALVPLVGGAILLGFFPLLERRAAAPLVPPLAFTRPLKIVNLIVLLFSAALFPMWYIGSLYLQQVLSLSPVDTGLVFLIPALVIFACASQAGKLVGRAGVKPVLGGGLLLMTGGLLALSRIGSGGSAIQYVMIPTILTTMGIGFSIVPSTIAATQAADPERAGLASGLVNTARQIGGGLGLAVLISIATQHTSHLIGSGAGTEQALTDGFRLGYLIAAGLCGVAALLTFALVPSTAHRSARAPLGVLTGAALVLALFAGFEFGVPRSHAAPIGRWVGGPNTWSFASAPSLHPPRLALYTKRKLDGYVMTANFYDLTKPPIVGQSGPLMLDSSLDPVWFRPVPSDEVASDLHAQTYEGKPVLSWWEGKVTATGLIDSGEDVVVNQHYRTVARIVGRDGWVITLHEMIIRGHDAYVTVNKNVRRNLSGEGGVDDGVMVDSGVQVYNLRTGRLVATWDAAKHINPRQSRVQPPTNGFPWDAYHINSISLQPHDEMLVSMRNTSALYLVSMRTGRILWTLGGKQSDFTIPRVDRFSWQHDAQLHPGNVLTVFDDHCCDITGAGVYLPASGPSRGLEMKLHPATHTVTPIAQYSHGVTFHAEYMGNVERLRGGDTFVGWGEVPFLTEFNRKGSIIFDGSFPAPDMSYRAYLQKWVGRPLTRPSVAVRHASAGTEVYVSWNGATLVRRWRVKSASGATLANVPRAGFETTIPLPGSAREISVQALSASGAVLSTSAPVPAGR
ncbi:MAG TPA: MFS transporter [Solirubrobacteraceae bacterium]|nr:MFS transporter [Solirubrobacteraceae bacterium]